MKISITNEKIYSYYVSSFFFFFLFSSQSIKRDTEFPVQLVSSAVRIMSQKESFLCIVVLGSFVFRDSSHRRSMPMWHLCYSNQSSVPRKTQSATHTRHQDFHNQIVYIQYSRGKIFFSLSLSFFVSLSPQIRYSHGFLHAGKILKILKISKSWLRISSVIFPFSNIKYWGGRMRKKDA